MEDVSGVNGGRIVLKRIVQGIRLSFFGHQMLLHFLRFSSLTLGPWFFHYA